jgi:DNA repair exonuclease SbcCD ATPase subunit
LTLIGLKIMKKISYVSLVLALALPLTLSARTPELPKGELGINVRASSSASSSVEAKVRNDARKASSTERREELQQDIAERKAARVGAMLEKTIERLEKILDRVESRIEKLESAGKDTATAEGHASTTAAHLVEARASLDTYMDIELEADTLRENFEEIREAASEVKMHLREAHRSLVQAIVSLKSSVNVETSTSTNPTN